MRIVKILCGGYGAKTSGGIRLVHYGELIELDDDEADRLIELNLAAEAAGVPANAEEPIRAGDDTPDAETAQKGAVGHLDADQLSTMTVSNLKKLAEDMELDTAKCRVKADYVALISSADVIVPDEEDEDVVDDGELPPDLDAEAPEA